MTRRGAWSIRAIAVRGLAGGMTACGAAFVVSAWMRRSVRGRLFAQIDEVQPRDVAIVPGARIYPDGTPSAVLTDRLNTALDLYRSRRVKKILVSGDAGAREGDESNVMGRWLMERHVSPSNVLVDPVGVRTLATMERAYRVYGVREAVICTQAFHLQRSVFLALSAGIDAVGMASDRREYRKRFRNRVRDFFAKQVAFLEGTVFRG